MTPQRVGADKQSTDRIEEQRAWTAALVGSTHLRPYETDPTLPATRSIQRNSRAKLAPSDRTHTRLLATLRYGAPGLTFLYTLLHTLLLHYCNYRFTVGLKGFQLP